MLYFEHSGYGYSKNRCEDAVQWFIYTYLPRHKIDLIIKHRGLKREFVHGWANIEDSDYRPRCFFIELQSNLSPVNYTTTLFHELWHVYQWVKGDLKERGIKRLWKGIDHTETDYEDQPWEIEAREMELQLYQEYMSEAS
jgi:hypothetical protein